MCALLLLLTQCHYQWGRGNIDNYSTFTLPAIEGDEEGVLTSLLVQEISSRTNLKFHPSQKGLLLKICLSPRDWESIGYTLAPKNEVDNTKVVVSNEGRIGQTALVTLIDQSTSKALLGPISVTAFMDYDYEPDFSNIDFHAQALGQLEMDPQARLVARGPLYKALSKKIVDYLLLSW